MKYDKHCYFVIAYNNIVVLQSSIHQNHSFLLFLDTSVANGFKFSQDHRLLVQANGAQILHPFAVDADHHFRLLQVDLHPLLGTSGEDGGEVVEGAVHHLIVMVEVRFEGSVRLRLPDGLGKATYLHQELPLTGSLTGCNYALDHHFLFHH